MGVGLMIGDRRLGGRRRETFSGNAGSAATDSRGPCLNTAAMGPSPDSETALAKRFHAELRRLVEGDTYRLWLAAVEVLGEREAGVAVSLPARNRRWVAERFGWVLAEAARRATEGRVAGVCLAEEGSGAPSCTPRPTANPRQTFATFTVGHANRLAHNAALTVAELPAASFNPLFLAGPPGCGKTHLLNAATAALAENHPQLKVLSLSGEGFANAFLSALRRRRLGDFKDGYRRADVFVVDDVDFICGKERTEEELLHTIAAVVGKGGQVIVSAPSPPDRLAFKNHQLRSTLAAGLVADLGPPDPNLRLALLRRRAAEHRGLELEDGALEVIAGQVEGSVRDLFAALMRAIAYASLRGEPLTAAAAAKVVGALYPQAKQDNRPTVAAVVAATARRFSVEVSDLTGKSRRRNLAAVRAAAAYLSRHLAGASLQEIGAALGGRDHTTVRAAIQRCEGELNENPQLRLALGEIAASLGREPDFPKETPAVSHTAPLRHQAGGGPVIPRRGTTPTTTWKGSLQLPKAEER